MDAPILELQDVQVHFPVFKGVLQRLLGRGDLKVHAVDGVTISLQDREVLGVVGESGCGKSTLGRAIVGLVPVTGGRILYRGQNVTRPAPKERVRLRREIQIVYQDPHAALNPAMTVGAAISDVLRFHGIATRDGQRVINPDEDSIRAAVDGVFKDVGLHPPEFFFDKFPYELSGGQKQRAVLARVLALRPRVLVADEPVAMLDMSVRALVLQLLLDLKERYGLTYIFITHDLATAKFMCDRIAIMYLGRIVEIGEAEGIYADPKHPYTRALLQAIPVPDPERRTKKVLPRGEVPNAIWPPTGCRFHPRCPVALPTCGWEGRDFINFLEERWLSSALTTEAEELGPANQWEADNLVARREVRNADPRVLAERVRRALSEAGGPMAEAVQDIRPEDQALVLHFRPPDPLRPKQVSGRLVECLLY